MPRFSQLVVLIMFSAGFISAMPPAQAMPQPTGVWSFDQPGNRVEDASGHGLAGTATNCGRAAGHSGQALKLDGTGGVTVPYSPLLRGKTGFTIDCWIKSDVPPGPPMNIVSKGNEFMVRVDPPTVGGTISFFVWCDGSGWEPRVRGPRLETGRWYHLVASWDTRTARLLVDRTLYQSSKPGICPHTPAPLSIGGPSDGLAGFKGLIDEVRIMNVPVGPLTLTKVGYGLEDLPAGQGRRDAAFDFRQGLQGWAALGDATTTLQNGALQASFHAPDAMVMVRGLAVDAATHPLCNVRLAASKGPRGVCIFVGDKMLKEVPIRLITDGAMHTYTVNCAAPPPWDGTIQAIGFYVDGAANADVKIESLALDTTAAAPPDVRILSLSPERRISGLKQSLPVTCWLRNDGGDAGDVELRLSAAPGIRVNGEAAQRVKLDYQQQAEVKWTVTNDAPVEGQVRVEVTCGGKPCAAMERPVSFTQDPEAAAIAMARARPWLTAGYPKCMDFRHIWPDSVGFLEHNTAFLISFIGSKISAALDLKRRYPDRLVLMQVNDELNGIWGSWHVVPREFAVKEGLHCDPVIFPMPKFRGYWLLGAGGELTRDFPADAETCEVPMPDPQRFMANVYGFNVPRDVLIYRRVNGKPDWEHSEYASVTKIDAAKQTITLQRWPKQAVGEWLSFRAGEAYVAPSVGSIYHGALNRTWMKTWIPNLTKFCPRDPATGMDAVTWWAKHFANLWHTRIAATEPHPDGFEFDGLWESPLGDSNNDGVADGCQFGGVNYWRLGLYDFFRKLRHGDGFRGMEDGLILSDASDALGPRCMSLLNGSEDEEFPSFAGVDYYPSGLDLYRVWCANSAAPACPYIQGRFACDTYRDDDWRVVVSQRKFHSDSLVRLSIASACMGDGIYTYRTGSRRDIATIDDDKELLEYPWDEYCAGREGRYNWLGKPLGDAVRLTDHLGPDLLPAQTDVSRWSLSASDPKIHAEGPQAVTDQNRPAVQVNVVSIDTAGQRLRDPRRVAAAATLLSPETTQPLDTGKEYCVEFRVSSDSSYRKAGDRSASEWRRTQKFAWIGVRLEAGEASGILQTILVGPTARSSDSSRVRVALTLRAPADKPCRVAFLCGAELGPVCISDLHLREGCAEVFARRFEHGLVLANGSALSPHTFDINTLGGGRKYRRFLGAQAPEVNNGQPVGATLTLPPQDGILLESDPF